MARYLGLEGKRFGELTVIRWLKDKQRWECRCDCGRLVLTGSGDLKKPEGRATRRCRVCSHKATRMRLIKDLTGQRFGRLVVESRATAAHPIMWRCLCDCGGAKIVPSSGLSTGHTSSCGCLHSVSAALSGVAKRMNRVGEIHGVLTIIGDGYSNPRQIKCRCSCGTEFLTYYNNVRTGARSSCGCLSRGVNHPNYDPTLTEEDRAGRHRVSGIDRWRSSVYTRDDFTCQACLKRGGKLVVHHIKAWKHFKYARLFRWNGVTLCSHCHNEFHTEYGQRDNSKTKTNWKQFIPWLRRMRTKHGRNI